jgi:hypothetical protein
MNRKIAFALLLASTGAYADDITMEPPFSPTLTREQVLQEFQQSRDEVAAFTGEDSGSMFLALHPAQAAATRTAGDDASLAAAPRADQ